MRNYNKNKNKKPLLRSSVIDGVSELKSNSLSEVGDSDINGDLAPLGDTDLKEVLAPLRGGIKL